MTQQKCKYATPQIIEGAQTVKGDSYHGGFLSTSKVDYDPTDDEMDELVFKYKRTQRTTGTCDVTKEPLHVVPLIIKHTGYVAKWCPVCSKIKDKPTNGTMAGLADKWTSDFFEQKDWDEV